jgi:DNA repair exonuclease SbcCD ATPase subunit
METLWMDLVSKGGMAGILLYAAWKGGNKVYDNMVETQKKLLDKADEREEKLMDAIKEQTDINARTAQTLERIDKRMESMDGRICTLEEYCREVKHGNT